MLRICKILFQLEKWPLESVEQNKIEKVKQNTLKFLSE